MSAVQFRTFAGAFALVAMAASVSAVDARVPYSAAAHAGSAHHTGQAPHVIARYFVPGSPYAFAIGSDGNPWYFGAVGFQNGLAITKVDVVTSKTTTFSWTPDPSCAYCTSQWGRIILNQDGNLYFKYTDVSVEPYFYDSLASVSPTASFQNFGGPKNTYVHHFISDIANGPDGSVWSIQGVYNCQGGPSCFFSMPPTVEPANMPVPAPLNASNGDELATGADGDLWEADNDPDGTPGILHVDPHTNSVYHRYKVGVDEIVAGVRPYSTIAFIASATAGTVGYVDFNDHLHQHNVGAAITSSTLAVAQDGSVWAGAGADLVRVGFNGRVTHITVAPGTQTVGSVVSDAQGNIWYATSATHSGQMRGAPSATEGSIGELQV